MGRTYSVTSIPAPPRLAIWWPPPIWIPESAVSATLSYCSAYGGESGNSNSSGYDWAWVEVNGVELDDVSLDGDQADWEMRAVDLTTYAGQEVILSWHFDSRDGTANSELGWQVDGIQVVTELAGLNALRVDDDAPGGGDGLTWNTAYDDLEDALSAAQSDPNVTEIRVAGGTYVPSAETDPNNPRTATFQLLNGVTLRGGYAGLANPSQPDVYCPAFYESILSGDLAGNDNPNAPADPNDPLRNENCYHVFCHPGGLNLDATAVLDGLTIAAGNANGTGWPDYYNIGGGMYNRECSPTLSNCTFSASSATYGGGMHNNTCSPTLVNCVFKANSTRYDGAGMSNSSNATPTLINCTFTENVADEDGGGMSNDGSASPTLNNCTFTANVADSFGGGMSNINGASPTLNNCTFTANAAAGWGGGMYNFDNGNPTLINCTFTANSTYAGGGMFNYWNSSPTLTNCTFTGNSAISSGGGMRNIDGSNPTLTNCTFIGNFAESGGGISHNDSSSTLTNCILWGDTAWVDPEIYTNDTNPNVTYCCIQGGWEGTGNIDVDPLLTPDGHLLAGAPCIDAGDDTALPPDVSDLDGDGNTTEPIP